MFRAHQTAKRRVVLIAASGYCLTRALAYSPAVRAAPIQDPIIAATGGLDWLLHGYVGAWAIVGLWCLLELRTGRIIGPLSAMSGLMAAWGTAWLLGWIAQPATTWWMTAATYWGPAVLTLTLVNLTPRLPPRSER